MYGTLLFFLLMFPLQLCAQTRLSQKADSLKWVKTMPYNCREEVEELNPITTGCGDHLFWDVVRLKDKAIPYLLEMLDDSTTTEASVPLFGYQYTVADIAYEALSEIVHGIPTFELLGIRFDENGCGYCAYWKHLNKRLQNRKDFKTAVKQWYKRNKNDFVWVASHSFSSCDCSGQHPNGGHYELKK